MSLETHSALFRFDRERHEYLDPASGEIYPHISGMLEASGVVDDLWFTDDGSERGTIVHKLTADYDLGAIEQPESVVSIHKGYLLAHVAAVRTSAVQVLAVEEPRVHPVHLYGGRPDREVIAFGLKGVWEIKSGGASKAHPIQTALQAILVAPSIGLPPEHVARFCCYIQRNGRFKLEQHTERRDLDEAYRLIHRYCAA